MAGAGRSQFDEFQDRDEAILNAPLATTESGVKIGRSRDGRPIRVSRFGRGPCRVSLLAGCHADEPLGPRLLRRLTSYLSSLPPDDPLLSGYEWWIVPDINPDGAERNAGWAVAGAEAGAFDIADYLGRVVREPPGDDIEFGFPRHTGDAAARPENRAVFDWWRTAAGPFDLHVSLHSTGFAAGPWFLIEAAWCDRLDRLKRRCVSRVADLGYVLHDVERQGEKGFFRLGRGFCTRPDSRYMRDHFLAIGDEETARKFRPSSMETIRAFGGDPLTLVSEMPHFLTPGVGITLGPPDPVLEVWRERIAIWQADLAAGIAAEDVRRAAAAAGLSAMPAADHTRLQWTFIVGGLSCVGTGSAEAGG